MWCLARADSVRGFNHTGRALGQGEEKRGSINSRVQSPLTSFIDRGQGVHGIHSFIPPIMSVEANFVPGLHLGQDNGDEKKTIPVPVILI